MLVAFGPISPFPGGFVEVSFLRPLARLSASCCFTPALCSLAFCCLAFCSLVLCARPASALAPTVQHPLDALIPSEYWTVYKAMRDAGHVEEKTIFSSVLLHEPEKSYVLAWTAGSPIERKADVVTYYKGHSYGAVVNISTAKVESFAELKGEQAPFTTTEEEEVNDAVKHDPRIVAALKKRGITDLNLVVCFATPGGFIALPGTGWQPHWLGRMPVRH